MDTTNIAEPTHIAATRTCRGRTAKKRSVVVDIGEYLNGIGQESVPSRTTRGCSPRRADPWVRNFLVAIAAPRETECVLLDRASVNVEEVMSIG